MSKDIQECVRCVMNDAADPDIRFDGKGICSYCHNAELAYSNLPVSEEQSKALLEKIVQEIKQNRTSKDYDCIIGLSGGVDSSYLAFLTHSLGLKPLAVHFDNGWDSEIAVSNIQTIVQKLGFDLITYVIDWEEFRDLQRAFFKASVVDIELLTDHAITAANFKIAKERNINVILSGHNAATEHGLPPSWIWNKTDLRNIRAIHKQFGEKRMRTFPTFSSFDLLWFKYVNPVYKSIPILNSVIYNRTQAKKLLTEQLGWRDYGGKHHESLFTKFYQGYILPRKFGIDKRRVHLSGLIRNGEITRSDALATLQDPLYDPVELRKEKEFVLKKLGFSEEEFDSIMNAPPCPHNHYPTDEYVFSSLRLLKGIVRFIGFCQTR